MAKQTDPEIKPKIITSKPKAKKTGSATMKRAAQLYAENIMAPREKRMTDQELLLKAGYSPGTHSTPVIQGKKFQNELQKLMPKEKIIERVSKGLNDSKNALGFCRLGAELHGLIGSGARGNHMHIENAVLMTDLLDYKPSGVVELEDGEL